MIFTRFLCVFAMLLAVVQSFEHVIMVGNPGSGKSTLLNSLIGKVVFSSGVSLDNGGRTKVIQTYIDGLVKYSDTPGLDDIKRKEEAAKEIEGLLQGCDNVKIIFVIMLDSWRVRTTDIATIKVVLDSLGQGDMTNKFSVIVNQSSEEFADVMSVEGALKLFKDDLFKTHRTDHILFQEYDNNAREKQSAIVDVSELKASLSQLAYISIDKSKLKQIDVKSIETVRKEAEIRLKDVTAHYEEQLRLARLSKPKRKNVFKKLIGHVEKAVNVVAGVTGVVETIVNLPASVISHPKDVPRRVLKEAERTVKKVEKVFRKIF